MNKHRDAIAAFQQGQIAEACRLLDEVVQEDQNNAELWNDWATAQFAAGAIENAERGFSRALQLHPQHLDATTSLGLLFLSKGDRDRALPLLQTALHLLPTQQQQMLRALLEGQATPSAEADERILRILVIHDAFPRFNDDGSDLRLMQILRALREQKHEVTFIARDGANRNQCEPPLLEIGVRTYGGDSERLVSLGQKAGPPEWSLIEILSSTKFNLAILSQTFNCGISVPEQYLNEIRHHSPGTRVALLIDELRQKSGLPVPQSADEQQKFERSQDWSSRELGACELADLVMVTHEQDAVVLREKNIEVACADNLDNAITHARGLVAKRQASEPLSIMLVEDLFAEKLSAKAGEKRILGQLESYVGFAQQLLRENKVKQAREQLRHVFGRLNESINAGQFHSQVFAVLKRCYRELGETELAEACARAARHSAIEQASNEPPAMSSPGKHNKVNDLLFSLIVPTYNRLPILKKCLAALEAQTLSAKKFEVIVIDDGSSDGTSEFMQGYRPAFRLRYLQQNNSGTGAARRNGVSHATGEYLLLMNDDTICNPDVIEQHLRVQQSYPDQRWAVLGNFEYPAEARQRALTHYFCVEPFMFPQVAMEAGCPYGYSHFITCNLSVRCAAVMDAGSFDSTYKLSEDTELGIRLFERGYRVLYHPEARARHDHLPYFSKSLIRRARVYGADYFYMFRNHPRVMKEWAMPIPLTGMDEGNAVRILGYVEEHRREVEEAMAALERWDTVEFEPLLEQQKETASMVLGLFRQAVPAIHWFYLFETMLNTMVRELDLPHLSPEPLAIHAAGSGD